MSLPTFGVRSRSLERKPAVTRKKEGDRMVCSEEISLLLSHGNYSSDDDNDQNASRCPYETAVEKAGFGKFHYWLLFICGWANAGDAIEILCISFLLPSAQCDLKLTGGDKGWLSAILFIGMLLGGYLWGGASDVYGRKMTLISAMFVNAVSGFASSLCQEKTSFFVVRFISGFGVGGSIPVVWSYFGEFQPKDKRGMMLSCLASFWMIGNITVALIAWLIIPHDIGILEGPFLFNSWRIFTFICGIPALIVTILLFTLPESPKYLVKKNEAEKALKIISHIYESNTGHRATTFPVKELTLEKVPKKTGSHISRFITNTLALFSRGTWKVTLMLLYINFSIMFGYYGLWLWFPELFNRLDTYYEDYPDASVSVCEITDYKPKHNSTDEDSFCGERPDQTVFLNSIFISLAAAPTNIWTILHMDKLGRKFFLVSSMILSGLSAFLVYTVRSERANLLVSCAFGLVSAAGFNSLDCLGIELFPTSVRSTGMSITLVAGRLGAIVGNIVFGYLVESNCAIPILSVAALLMSGGFVGWFLPNTSRTSLS